MKNQHGLQGAQRLLFVQLGLTALVAVALLFVSPNAALSALLGGLVSAIPNAYFARKLFQYQGAQAARQIVNGFYKGEALKIALSVALFALVFAFFKVVPLIFFIVYIGVQMVIWFAPLIFPKQKQNRP